MLPSRAVPFAATFTRRAASRRGPQTMPLRFSRPSTRPLNGALRAPRGTPPERAGDSPPAVAAEQVRRRKEGPDPTSTNSDEGRSSPNKRKQREPASARFFFRCWPAADHRRPEVTRRRRRAATLDGVTSGVERLEQHRRLLVALLIAVLALVVGVGVGVDAHASSPGGEVAGTRVKAHDLLAGPVVAAVEDVLAGEGRRPTTQALDVAIGSRVAPNTAGLADDAIRIKPGSASGTTSGQRFPSSVRREALEENPSTCVYCRMETNAPQVDHAIPLSRGGNATLDNAQTTCPWCNASKGARDFPVNPPPGYRGAWPPWWW